MTKVFLDASVIISGIASDKGASNVILKLSKKKKIVIFVSAIILKEVLRNLQKKFSEDIYLAFIDYLPQSNFQKINLKENDLLGFKKITEEKDIHVVAAAVKAKVNFLITLDKKHLLRLREKNLPYKIITPGEFLHVRFKL